MKRDPLLSPTLADRPAHSGPWPWRLQSLYPLAFFGGGVASAAIAYVNARRLGLPDDVRHQLASLGAAYLLLFGLAMSAIGVHALSIGPEEREAFGDALRDYRLLTPLASLGLTWWLVRIQMRADRLYQIESGSSHRYSSLWAPGLIAAIASVALHIVVAVSVGLVLAGGVWTLG